MKRIYCDFVFTIAEYDQGAQCVSNIEKLLLL